MNRFEAHYDKKAVARASAAIKIFVGAGGVLIMGGFAYYATVLSQLGTLNLLVIFAVMLVGDFLFLKVADKRMKRYRTHARSGIPAIIFDSRGVWVHERCGDAPILWETISEVEEMGSGKNRGLRIHSHPGAREAKQPVMIPDGLYDAPFTDIVAALGALRERYG